MIEFVFHNLMPTVTLAKYIYIHKTHSIPVQQQHLQFFHLLKKYHNKEAANLLVIFNQQPYVAFQEAVIKKILKKNKIY